MESFHWNPEIIAGHAASRDSFTISLCELEYDDPYSAIISFDGAFPQPWSRVDVDREIVDIAYSSSASQTLVPIALSNEGDVYTLEESGADWYKIPGAGILSDDADGRGVTYALAATRKRIWVAGKNQQLYTRTPISNWTKLSLNTDNNRASVAEDFIYLALHADGRPVIVAQQDPPPVDLAVLNDPRYHPGMGYQKILELMSTIKNEIGSTGPETRLYFYEDSKLVDLGIPKDIHVRALIANSNNGIWLTGVGGLVINVGIDMSEIQRFDVGETRTFVSAAWFRNALILTTGRALFAFSDGQLLPLKPRIPRNADVGSLAITKLQSIDSVLFLFDARLGVCRWDGSNWDWITLPQELMARPFPGFR